MIYGGNMKKISTYLEHKDQIINLYEMGKSSVEIAKMYGVTSSTISNLLRRFGVKTRKRHDYHDEATKQKFKTIEKLIKEGKSNKEIHELTGYKKTHISTRRNSLKPSNSRRQYKFFAREGVKNSGFNCSLDEVAKELYKQGLTDTILSRERIRQIQNRALNKLIKYFRSRGFNFRDFWLNSTGIDTKTISRKVSGNGTLAGLRE